MQTLVPIGTFEEKARKRLGNAGFDDLLEFLARRPKAKADQDNLTNAQKAKLRKHVNALIDEYS